ncbi:MAG: sensor histidine kinase [Coprobacillaceae bacterium]
MKVGMDRMGILIQDLLALTRVEEEATSVLKSKINISDLVIDTSELMESVALEKGLEFNYDVDSNIMIESNSEIWKSIITILLDNAIKYTEDNKDITISLKEDKKKVYCSIQNYGHLLTKEESNRIFDRFYRIDASRSKEVEGHGLGLSLAKTLVEQIEGRIHVESSISNGNIFTIIIEK